MISHISLFPSTVLRFLFYIVEETGEFKYTFPREQKKIIAD